MEFISVILILKYQSPAHGNEFIPSAGFDLDC